jgi:phage terminase large subunit GpA-like protein
MGFLAPSEAIIAAAMGQVMAPPPPPDITRWCEQNIVFDERSPMPGPFNIARFPFLRDIHLALSPEHPAREVTIRGSAQWGKTVSIIQPTLGAWHEYGPLDSLVVHPTQSAAVEWVDNKWLPMRRQATGLREIFGDGRGANTDSKFNQETLNRNGSLKVASAGSPADLTGTTRRLVILDDLSKFEMTDKGDPEALALSRASGFEDAKILRVSTPLFKSTCRISKAFARSTQQLYHVPCPHCGNMAPLTWENFVGNIDPAHLSAAHFTCDSCGCVIGHGFKEQMVAQGKWVAQNPRGDHPGFHLWRAYAPQRDWASIAQEYAQVMGWTRIETAVSTEPALSSGVEAETEQTFWNDVLGLPYEQATSGPDWEVLRDRAELAPDEAMLPLGVVPASGVLLTAGVDCQDDRIEVHIVAYGRNRRRWGVDYRIIPHHISDEAGRTALDALLKATWRTALGLKLPLDMLAIDVNTYTDDVWSWGKKHPWDRVILVRGQTSQNGPVMSPIRTSKNNGKALRTQKRAFNLNTSQIKGDFYTWLKKDDPEARGYCQFARGLGDEYYRQLSSEVRVLRRSRSGAVTSAWELVEPTRRNEVLDTMVYSEAAARRKGWTSKTDDEWDHLADERGVAPPDVQPDLFDATPPAPKPDAAPAATSPRQATQDGPWVPQRKDWI